MKHWKVDFSTIQHNAVVEESEIIVEAMTISGALGKAHKELNNMIVEGYDFVIWNIGIMEDDVL